MEHIDLNHITEEHLLGEWEVKERINSNPTSENPFSCCRIIHIEKQNYKTINGKVRNGKFMIFREKELIYNPQVKFSEQKSSESNAIITRLFIDKIDDKTKYNLTIYFTTGLELILQKTEKI